jgi:hypothetical protein
MTPDQSLVPGVLAPALLAGLLLALGWRPWRSDVPGSRPAAPDGSFLAGLALGSALFLANGLMFGWPALPQAGRALPALERVAWIGLAFGALACLERPLCRLTPALWIAAAGAALWWLLEAFGRASDVGVLGGALGSMVALGGGLHLLARRAPGAWVPLVLLLAGSGSALAIALRVSAKIGQLEGALCAGMGALWVLCLWRPRVVVVGSGLATWVLLHSCLLLLARIYRLPALDLGLLAAAPLAAWVAEIGPLRRRAGWIRGGAGLAATGALLGVVLARAWLAYQADPYGP